jgi:hypothetical protein
MVQTYLPSFRSSIVCGFAQVQYGVEYDDELLHDGDGEALEGFAFGFKARCEGAQSGVPAHRDDRFRMERAAGGVAPSPITSIMQRALRSASTADAAAMNAVRSFFMASALKRRPEKKPDCLMRAGRPSPRRGPWSAR